MIASKSEKGELVRYLHLLRSGLTLDWSLGPRMRPVGRCVRGELSQRLSRDDVRQYRTFSVMRKLTHDACMMVK